MTDRKFANIMVGLLSLQFALGTLASLYSTVPSHEPGKVFDHFGFIVFHALNGLIVLVLSFVFLMRSRKSGLYVQQARGGLSSIISAFAFGELFVFTQNDIFSFFMAMSFLGALLAYARIAFSGPLAEPKSSKK